MTNGNIKYLLLNDFVHGIDEMKWTQYISYNVSQIHINMKYFIFHFISL
jgi:hypothetical protein